MQFVGQWSVLASEQRGVFANSTTQHLPGGRLAMSIAVAIDVPDDVIAGGQQNVVDYVERLMSPLPDNVSVEVWIGHDDERPRVVRGQYDDSGGSEGRGEDLEDLPF